MANKCQVQTPKKYVIEMLDYIGYNNQLYGKRVLENSCGEGNILCEIVRRYIQDARRYGYSDREIVNGLEEDVCAYETDCDCIRKCKRRLNKVVYRFGIKGIKWNIKNEDFLKSQGEVYDFIIGNPPYITYHDLPKEQRIFLRDTFISCKEGRFDYSYAFIEASLYRLGNGGKMVYLVPYSVKTNKFAKRLREVLKPYLKAIYDYKTIKIFPDAITSTVIILCENVKNITGLDCYIVNSNQMIHKEKLLLRNKWILERESEQENNIERCFGDYFEVLNSVATLCNRAFVLKEYVEESDYYTIGQYRIERQLVKNAASTKSFNKRRDRNIVDKIIFPYKHIDGAVFRFRIDEFEQMFPYGSKYLQQFEEELDKRKVDQRAFWFEYGRSQAITKVFGKKLILPMVITKSVSVYLADDEEIPYAGYFIRKKADSSLTLEDAKKIIESDDFYEYVKKCGTPTTPTSYRISVNDIKDFKISEEWLNG